MRLVVVKIWEYTCVHYFMCRFQVPNEGKLYGRLGRL